MSNPCWLSLCIENPWIKRQMQAIAAPALSLLTLTAAPHCLCSRTVIDWCLPSVTHGLPSPTALTVLNKIPCSKEDTREASPRRGLVVFPRHSSVMQTVMLKSNHLEYESAVEKKWLAAYCVHILFVGIAKQQRTLTTHAQLHFPPQEWSLAQPPVWLLRNPTDHSKAKPSWATKYPGNFPFVEPGAPTPIILQTRLSKQYTKYNNKA